MEMRPWNQCLHDKDEHQAHDIRNYTAHHTLERRRATANQHLRSRVPEKTTPVATSSEMG
jgi:hypothetical protein